jgi:hypothetical protein
MLFVQYDRFSRSIHINSLPYITVVTVSHMLMNGLGQCRSCILFKAPDPCIEPPCHILKCPRAMCKIAIIRAPAASTILNPLVERGFCLFLCPPTDVFAGIWSPANIFLKCGFGMYYGICRRSLVKFSRCSNGRILGWAAVQCGKVC